MSNLIELGFELTNRCNLNCVHCLRDKTIPKADLSFAVIEKTLGEAKSFGVEHLYFSGGECTLHPQFKEILAFVDREGFSFTFITNGFNFQQMYPHILKHIEKGSLEGIGFSLDGAGEEVHDRIRGKGSFKRVMQAVSVCLAKKIPYSIETVVSAWNRHQMNEMALMLSQLKCKQLNFTHLQPTEENMQAGMLLCPQDFRQVEEEVLRMKEIYRLPIEMSVGYYSYNPLFMCNSLEAKTISVDFEGNIVFCCQLSSYNRPSKGDIIGSLAQESLAELYGRLLDKINAYNHYRLSKIKTGNFADLDYFPCYLCSKFFGKLNHLAKFPDSPWAKGLS